MTARFIPLMVLALAFNAPSWGQPVRDVYVFSATHSDITFTGPPPYSYDRHQRIYDAVLELASKQPDLRFLIESMYMFDQYLRVRPEQHKAFASAIQDGQVGLAAQMCTMLQNLTTGEDLVRNILLAHGFGLEQFGVRPSVLSLSDVPGQNTQTPQILNRAGLDGAIITRVGPRDTHLFHWRGMDGSVARAVTLPFGYPGGYMLGMAESLAAMEGREKAVFELSDMSEDIFLQRVEQPIAFEPGVLFAHPGSDRALLQVSWDNALPPAKLADNIASWNEKHGGRLRIHPALPHEFFQDQWPEDVALKEGAIPSAWFNGGWSLIGGYQQHMRTSHTLQRSEKWSSLAAILAGFRYPAENLSLAWSEHLMTLDHEGVSLYPQRNLAEGLARRTLTDAQQALAGRIPLPREQDIALVVFNSLNWDRNAFVTPLVYLVGTPFTFFTRPWHELTLVDSDGNEVPFEVVETQSTIVRAIRIRFRATQVPALGWRTYYLRPVDEGRGRQFAPAESSSESGVSVDTSVTSLTFSDGTLRIHDNASGREVALDYFHQPQKLSEDPGFFRAIDTEETVPVEWHNLERGDNLAGPYLMIQGSVGAAGLQLRVQLTDSEPTRIDETVYWNGGESIKLVRKAQFSGPGRFVYGAPFGSQELDALMEGAGPGEELSFDEISRADWLRNREFDGWAAWISDERNTVLASEARGGTFDGRTLRSTVLASSSPLLPDALEHPTPGEFKTRLSVSFSGQPASGPRASWELYNPLKVMTSVANLSSDLPAVFRGATSSPELALTTLKRAEDGEGFIARAYSMGARTRWPGILPQEEWRAEPATLTEEAADPAPAFLEPFEIRTVRLRRNPQP